MAGYANSVFALMFALAYVMSNRNIASQWAQIRIASLFAMSASIMFLNLVTVLNRPQGTATNEWTLLGHLVASVSLLLASICTGFFAFVSSRELKLRYSFVLLGIFVQGVAFCLVFVLAPRLIQKLLHL
jgi:hypothetical protein